MEANIWAPIAFGSRFINDQEKKYNMNELGLLAIVWSCEYFSNFEVLKGKKQLFWLLALIGLIKPINLQAGQIASYRSISKSYIFWCAI